MSHDPLERGVAAGNARESEQRKYERKERCKDVIGCLRSFTRQVVRFRFPENFLCNCQPAHLQPSDSMVSSKRRPLQVSCPAIGEKAGPWRIFLAPVAHSCDPSKPDQGTAMSTDVLECPHCGEQVAADADSCIACGHLHVEGTCTLHPERKADGVCVMCGTALCEECNRGAGTMFVCADHASVPVMDGWAQVYTTSDDLEAELIRDNLESEGIDAQVLSQKDHFSFTVDIGARSPVRVLVPAFAYQDAQDLLPSHKSPAGEV